MRKKIKSLLLSLIIVFGIFGANTSTSDALTYMYTTAGVNIRQYNSTYSKKVGYAPKGSKVNAYNKVSGWYSIYYPTGKVWGYIKDDYLSTSKGTVTINKGQVLKKLVIVNKDSLKVAYYQNGKLVKSMPCAIGKSSTPTPSGKFTIINKQKNRPYYKKNIPGGAYNNPLGTRFMQLTRGGIALHGTCYPNSIGKRVSDGCIRLTNTNAEWLYNRVYLGTQVVIGNGYNKNIASKYGYKIY